MEFIRINEELQRVNSLLKLMNSKTVEQYDKV